MEKTKLKRVISVVLGLVLVFSILGCSKKDDIKDTTQNDSVNGIQEEKSISMGRRTDGVQPVESAVY